MYNKLFTKILDSSIWLETDSTRIVWLTFIATMDESGFCQFAALGNLAGRARVSLESAVEAVKQLEGPDENSSDPENEGRRIERVPGGWMVLNAAKYRELVTRAITQERTRVRVARFRERKRDVTNGNATVTLSNDPVTPSEAYAESKSEAVKPLRGPKAPQERNLLMDALASINGADPKQVTPKAWGGIAKSLAEIRSVCPSLTVEEVGRRAANYRLRMPNAQLTPFALSKHWADCDLKPTNGREVMA